MSQNRTRGLAHAERVHRGQQGAVVGRHLLGGAPVVGVVDREPLGVGGEERGEGLAGDAVVVLDRAGPCELDARVLDVDLGQRLVLERVVGNAVGLVEQRPHQLAVDDPHLPRVLAAEADGAQRVGAVAERDELVVGAADHVGAAKRARRAQQREERRSGDRPPRARDRVPDPLDVGRGRARHLGRPQLRDLGAVALGDRGDLRRVGRDDHRVEDAGRPRGGDRVGDQRVAGELADVLARDPLGAGAGRDQRDGGRHARRLAAPARGRLRGARGRG